ncbi:MAG: SRPBCC family protein [Acidimicrobiia bacterium]
MTDAAGPLTTIEQTVRIAATPETIWSFWTDPARVVEWWGLEAEVVPEPGGLFRVTMETGSIMRGSFVELDPPRRLVFTFGWEQNARDGVLGPGSSRVEVTITPDGDETLVVLRHFEMPVTHAPDHEKGWRLLVGERLPAAIAAT